jgi:hypothetical protein
MEVKYDNFPVETGWTLRESAATLVTGQSAGSFSTEDGTVFKTAYIAEGAYTFEMAGTYGDGICCRYGAGEFKISVNGEPVAISSSSSSSSSSGEF